MVWGWRLTRSYSVRSMGGLLAVGLVVFAALLLVAIAFSRR